MKYWGLSCGGERQRRDALFWNSNNELDLAVAEQDGYLDLGIAHRRAVLFYKPDCLVIKDQLSGKGNHVFEQLWHLLPGVLARVEENYIKLQCDGQEYAFLSLDGPTTQMEVIEGQVTPIQGWFSARYGEKVPAPALQYSVRENLPAIITTPFIPVGMITEDRWLEKKRSFYHWSSVIDWPP